MSVIKRLGNLAKGQMKVWSDGDEPPPDDDALRAELQQLEDEARSLNGQTPTTRPSPSAAPVAPVMSPLEARRQAVKRAFREGVISEEERDGKLDAIDTEAFRPPTPKPRRL